MGFTPTMTSLLGSKVHQQAWAELTVLFVCFIPKQAIGKEIHDDIFTV
jgi:hypothetical protein